MENAQKLTAIKIVHTLIWAFFVVLIGYVLYCGITNQITKWTWLAVALVLLEGLVLLIFKFSCPLTLMARKYSQSTKENFDIFLPECLAKYNKLLFTSLFVVGLILVLARKLFAAG